MNNSKSTPNPREKANILSILTFSWYIKLCYQGLKKHLQFRDIYVSLFCDKSKKLGECLERNWNEEIDRSKRKYRNPSLLTALGKTFFSYYMFCGLLQFLQFGILLPMQPLLLANFLQLFSSTSATSSASVAQMCTIGVQMIVLAFVLAFFSNHLTLIFGQLGMRVKTACCHLIYAKILRLSHNSMKNPLCGHVLDLISTDLRKFDTFLYYLHYTWIVPVQTVIVTYLIWDRIGVAALIGISVFLLLTVPVNAVFSLITIYLKKKIDKKTDERLTKMDEIVSEIHVIKTNGWEKSFEEKVDTIRKQEIKLLSVISSIKGIISSTTVFLQKAILYITTVLCLLFGVPLAADNVFPLLQFYNILQLSLITNFPISIDYVSQTRKTLERLEQFLLLEEKFQPAITIDALKTTVLKNVNASWNKDSTTLAGLNVQIPPGILCVIMGPKGSGKTSLLQLLVGELIQEHGSITIGGNISYASQKPWIFASTIAQNIIFDQSYDCELYKKIVEVCGLEKDLDKFEKNDETLIGFGGISLNSGQRARINLARAMYKEADVYLVDDCLTLMSSKMERLIFDRSILEYLKNKTRIVVTSDLTKIIKADYIIALNKGKIEAQGTYEELAKLNFKFDKFVKEERPDPLRDDFFFSASMSLVVDEEDILLSSSMEDGSCNEEETSITTGCSCCLNVYSKVRNNIASLFQKNVGSKDECSSSYGGELSESDSLVTTLKMDEIVSKTGEFREDGTTPLSKSGLMSNLKRQISEISNKSLLKSSASSEIEYSTEHIEEIEHNIESVTGGTNYWEYITSGTNIWGIIKLIILLLTAQLVSNLADYWLTVWTKEQNSKFTCPAGKPDVNVMHMNHFEIINMSPDNNLQNYGTTGTCGQISKLPLYIYTFLIIFSVILLLWRSLYYYKLAMAASEHLHAKMLKSLIESPVSYFDENATTNEICEEEDETDDEDEDNTDTAQNVPPLENEENEDSTKSDQQTSEEDADQDVKTHNKLVSNYSKNINEVDNELPNSLFETLQGSLLSIGMFFLIVISNPYMIVITILLGFFLYKIRTWYTAIENDLKILEHKLKYPILAYLCDTLNGLSTVRASRNSQNFVKQFHDLQDNQNGAWYLTLVCGAAFGLWIDLLSAVYVALTIISFIFLSQFEPVNSSYVGLAITQSFILVGTVHYATKKSSKMEENINTTKKVIKITKLAKEGVFVTEDENETELAWPYGGRIQFIDVSLFYADSSTPAIENVTFEIEAGQKIGLVGESGSGKTSIVNAILRLGNVRGQIIIDEVDTSNVGLTKLRRNISLIPQTPILFTETLRFNLDPLGQYSDQEIWCALEMVQLKDEFDTLEYFIKDNGRKMSISKKQLLCLARAILRNNKILLLDNALENVDKRSDELIKNVIYTQFATATVLIIARNLDTVIDSDKIMVLDGGSLAEYDYPHELLQKKNGQFAEMVSRENPEKAIELKQLAQDAFLDNVLEIQESVTEIEEIIIFF